MATKDELLKENMELRAQVEALKADAALNADSDGDGDGAEKREPGVYVVDEDGMRRLPEGQYKVTQGDAVAAVAAVDEAAVDLLESRMTRYGMYIYTVDGLYFIPDGDEDGAYMMIEDEAFRLPEGTYVVVQEAEGGTYKEGEIPTDVRVRAPDGQFSNPVKGSMYVYDGSGDLVAVPLGTDKTVMLEADIQRVAAERDELRQANARLNQRLNGEVSMHGSIDSLKSVV